MQISHFDAHFIVKMQEQQRQAIEQQNRLRREVRGDSTGVRNPGIIERLFRGRSVALAIDEQREAGAAA